MAKDEAKKEDKKPSGGGAPKAAAPKQQKGGERKSMLPKGEHPGKDLPVPPPRLRDHYRSTVKPKLMKQFGFTNTHQAPEITWTMSPLVIGILTRVTGFGPSFRRAFRWTRIRI
jgi:hypothetical protein